MPKVSVIIPCFNQAQFLNECIDSVLNQTMQNFEIIVVDDGSDSLASVAILDKLDKPKTKLIRKKNGGLVSARNAGIEIATGKYILPLDCDDKIAPTMLEKCSAYLDEHDECGICGGLTELFGTESGVWDIPKYSWPQILLGNRLVATNMFRRDDWATVGGYNPNMTHGLEDWDFWLSILELGRTVFQFDEVLFFYRKHGESMISDLQKRAVNRQRMINQIIQNHRDTYDKYPVIVERLTNNLSLQTKIKDFAVRVLCLAVPVRDVRHKIKERFRYQ